VRSPKIPHPQVVEGLSQERVHEAIVLLLGIFAKSPAFKKEVLFAKLAFFSWGLSQATNNFFSRCRKDIEICDTD
jgi:hypothetical protein